MSNFIPLIIILLGIVLVVLIGRRFNPENEFDERQVAARGKAYRYAFFSTIWGAFLYAIITAIVTEKPIAQEGVIPALIALLGFGVFAVVSIINDAFLALNKKPASFFIIFALAAVSNGFAAVMSIIDGRMLENGLLAFPAMQLGCAVLFTTVMIVLGVKLIKNKKPEAEE